MLYKVVWEIDIEADNPEKAAQQALEIQRDPESIATVFRIHDIDSGDFICEVDLGPSV